MLPDSCLMQVVQHAVSLFAIMVGRTQAETGELVQELRDCYAELSALLIREFSAAHFAQYSAPLLAQLRDDPVAEALAPLFEDILEKNGPAPIDPIPILMRAMRSSMRYLDRCASSSSTEELARALSLLPLMTRFADGALTIIFSAPAQTNAAKT